jgi:NTP pyrophosphatase (non-canonical NTP hydrolase)
MAELTFNDYQSMAGETAIYEGQGELIGLMYVGLGLGEAGEIQGKIKKLHRDGGYGDPEKMEKIADELGDLLWYVANTASELGYDLNTIAERNLNKLNSRKERGVLGGSGDNR